MSRPEPTLINPAGLADPTEKGFSHLAIVPSGAKTVYISGQFGADVTGRIMSDDYAGQLRQSFFPGGARTPPCRSLAILAMPRVH